MLQREQIKLGKKSITMMNDNRALLEYNKEFVNCYAIALNPKRCEQISAREIEEKDIVELCNAINEMHMNELKYGGRNLWYITSQLLAGTILYHQRQVDFLYDESQRLQQSCLRRFVLLQKTQTIKRRTREIHTNTKRKRLVDEEITTNVLMWNSNEYEQDENDNRVMSELNKPDPCMRASYDITLRETYDIPGENGGDQHAYSRINDFGGIFNEYAHENDENLSVSEISGSVHSAPHDQEAIEENNMNQINVDYGRQNGNDVSCETIPATFPIKHVLYRDRTVKPKNYVDTAPAASPVARSTPKTVMGNVSIPRERTDNISVSPFDDHVILSQPGEVNILLSQLTDDNNNSQTPNAVDNNVTMQAEVILRSMGVEEFPVQPDDDISIGIACPATPIAPKVNDSAPNADEIILPSPAHFKPIDIAPPLLIVSPPLVIAPKPKRRSVSKRKNQTLCMDETITLDSEEMRTRIKNPSVDCKRPLADIMSKTDKLQRKEAMFFTEPTMFGQCNRQMFQRNLVQNDEENDLSIIHDILNIPPNERPDSVVKIEQESEVIEGDVIRRRSSRKRKAPNVEPRTRQHELEMVNAESSIDLFVDNDLNGIATCPLEMDFPLQIPRNSLAQMDEPLNDNDKMVLRELRMLWKRNVESVTMANITSRKSGRLQAAKNFASILSLKKLRLVEIEADENGQIQRITEGNAAASQNIP